MKEINITTKIKVYNTTKELPAEDYELSKKATAALDDSYSPYSNFQVAAAIRFTDGTMIAGSNQENASYPLCLCAERVVMSAAAALYPGKPIEAMAITVKNKNRPISEPVSPCGACRQSIREEEIKLKHAIKLILFGELGQVYVLNSGKDLLPLSFDPSFLE